LTAAARARDGALLVMAAVSLLGQAPASGGGLTLNGAVTDALKNYPSIRISQEQMNAAAAGIKLARTAYLPRVDLLAQANRATRNNIFGTLLPQSVIPAISGPVLGTNTGGSAWESAVGTLVTWEPFDFGAREASVAAARATRAAREATVKQTQFEISVAAADAYVTLAASEAAIRAAQAGVDRAMVMARTTGALVNAQLRPGADASRAEAELAAARTQWIQAQQAADLARANLARFTGLDPGQISLAGALAGNGPLRKPSDETAAPLSLAATPAAIEQKAVVEQVRAQLTILERSYFPRFFLQGAAYARGSGAEVTGAIQGGLNGLAPTTQDYALGFTVSFPLFERASIRAQEAEQAANMRAESARYQQIATDLQARWNGAVATLSGARRIAENTPIELTAARAATDQATARYKAGLGNIDEVAEAQRLLTQSEIDDALARLGVWRALLGVAAAAGDIQPFLAEAGQ
jgi:outer membrane protein